MAKINQKIDEKTLHTFLPKIPIYRDILLGMAGTTAAKKHRISETQANVIKKATVGSSKECVLAEEILRTLPSIGYDIKPMDIVEIFRAEYLLANQALYVARLLYCVRNYPEVYGTAKERAIALVGEGFSLRQAAAATGLSKETVKRAASIAISESLAEEESPAVGTHEGLLALINGENTRAATAPMHPVPTRISIQDALINIACELEQRKCKNCKHNMGNPYSYGIDRDDTGEQWSDYLTCVKFLFIIPKSYKKYSDLEDSTDGMGLEGLVPSKYIMGRGILGELDGDMGEHGRHLTVVSPVLHESFSCVMFEPKEG